jgi:regulator of protease activity HflC (stomatin/prohibitin superfamily)
MIQEKEIRVRSGYAMLLVLFLGIAAGIGLCVYGAQARVTVAREFGGREFVFRNEEPWIIAAGVVLLLVDLVGWIGFLMVQPNVGRVVQLFGKYKGTVKEPGLKWANVFFTKKKISLRVRNFETAHLKVNDLDGNPVEIAAVVVWQVVDTAEAMFNVDSYENYVQVQSEAAVRGLASRYPYDAHDDVVVSLRGSTQGVADHMKKEIQERLTAAGVQVLEARISHLAYAPEIAAVMLRRQQASAIIAARQKIVEGAVGMVEHAIELLSQKQVVALDEERKAAMVSNLLVVLCGEREAQPVVNAGTLYT